MTDEEMLELELGLRKAARFFADDGHYQHARTLQKAERVMAEPRLMKQTMAFVNASNERRSNG